VAYKTLHEDLRDSDIETKRFLREARVTANIQHPGTVPLYELGRDREGQLFFTMKKVDGRDLKEILFDLRQEVPEVVEKFPLPRLLDILIQVCQTIAYAHDIGVIHRDLKPANIIVGKFGEVYVLDWGLAKVLNAPTLQKSEAIKNEKMDTTLTPVGRHYGTPMYMPPEIARGEADLDGRTDVFSLGIILFEMLTLAIFSGRRGSLRNQKENPRPTSTTSTRGRARIVTYQGDLQAVCMKALKRNKYDRYSSATTFLEDLQHYRHQEEVSVYWYSGWERLTRWKSRHVYLIITTLSALLGAGLHALFSR
jgi:serine/threonine-protein kinase